MHRDVSTVFLCWYKLEASTYLYRKLISYHMDLFIIVLIVSRRFRFSPCDMHHRTGIQYDRIWWCIPRAYFVARVACSCTLCLWCWISYPTFQVPMHRIGALAMYRVVRYRTERDLLSVPWHPRICFQYIVLHTKYRVEQNLEFRRTISTTIYCKSYTYIV